MSSEDTKYDVRNTNYDVRKTFHITFYKIHVYFLLQKNEDNSDKKNHCGV